MKKNLTFEIIFATVIKIDDDLKEKKKLKKLFFVIYKIKFIQILKKNFLN